MDYLSTVKVIIFYGDRHKMEKLIEKFTELESKESVQIMGDILELNSFESEELNRLNFGVPKDFGLYHCRLYMENNVVRIYCDVGQPNEFLSNVCEKYNVMGKIQSKGGTIHIWSNSQGTHTDLEPSVENENWYRRDRKDFLQAALSKVRSNKSTVWGKLKGTYYFLSEEDYEKIEKVFIEVNTGSLF